MTYVLQSIPHQALRPRRVGVCGGGKIDPCVVAFCEKLGWELAGEEGLIIATGGSRHYIDHPEEPATEWSVVKGALARLEADGGRPDDRIETFLPRETSGETVRFRVGRVHNLYNRSWQARRFALVNSSDVLLSMQGGGGTKLQIDLALALERRSFPIPFTGGISRERWDENRKAICTSLGIDEAMARRLESVALEGASSNELRELAALITGLVVRNLHLKCFVIMPFAEEFDPLYEQAIEPAVTSSGFTTVRADRLSLVGNAIDALRSAMVACDCVLAVITGYNPNVMYELGFAHSLGKPAVLLHRLEQGESDPLMGLPFDLRTEFVMGYRDDWVSLKEQLGAVLRELITARQQNWRSESGEQGAAADT